MTSEKHACCENPIAKCGACSEGCTFETEQPPPKPPADPQAPAVWDLVKFDMEARDATGLRRYGTRLKPGNGRDALMDAYEEALDLVVYLRQALFERSGR